MVEEGWKESAGWMDRWMARTIFNFNKKMLINTGRETNQNMSS